MFALSGGLTLLAALLIPRIATPVLIATASVTVISVFAYSFIAWRHERESSTA
jgi:FtsH-binding integral membrane protein